MNPSPLVAFLPEWVLLAGALWVFVLCLGQERTAQARAVTLGCACATLLASLWALGQQAVLFDGAYRVDQFSQLFKVAVAFGFVVAAWLAGGLPDIRGEVRPEYHLFLVLSMCGLCMLGSSVEIITLVVSLELSSFPLYLLVAMRREREGQRTQMESAVKYIMFGVAANGVMLFGLSYLFGLTGTTSLPEMMERLRPVSRSPIAILGLTMTFCGLFYKLAVFPFHFWSPDVYQGASNETTGLIASLPKIGAVAVLIRFVALASPEEGMIAALLALLAAASMFYGNLIALWQRDLKRLLAFSGIAHAGYALVGFVALDPAGYTAAFYYIVAYMVMVLACFVVICRLSTDGRNLALEDLAGLHQRSPLLALTLVIAVFALAGMPPFAGFTGKLALLTAALAKGHLWLVVVAVLNTAVAVYYYLGVVRETCFRDAGAQSALVLDWPTRALCLLLIVGILLLGVAPARVLETISASLAWVNPAA